MRVRVSSISQFSDNMEYSAEGIILRSTPFEETFIIDLFTKEFGRIKFVAKQAKRRHPQCNFSALLGVEISVIPSEKEFWKCRECMAYTSYPKLRTQLSFLQQAAYGAKLLTNIVPLHLPQPEIYAVFTGFLEEIPNFLHSYTATAAFLAKCCFIEGLLPHERFSREELAVCTRLYHLSFKELSYDTIDKYLVEKLAELFT